MGQTLFLGNLPEFWKEPYVHRGAPVLQPCKIQQFAAPSRIALNYANSFFESIFFTFNFCLLGERGCTRHPWLWCAMRPSTNSSMKVQLLKGLVSQPWIPQQLCSITKERISVSLSQTQTFSGMRFYQFCFWWSLLSHLEKSWPKDFQSLN